MKTALLLLAALLLSGLLMHGAEKTRLVRVDYPPPPPGLRQQAPTFIRVPVKPRRKPVAKAKVVVFQHPKLAGVRSYTLTNGVMRLDWQAHSDVAATPRIPRDPLGVRDGQIKAPQGKIIITTP